MEDKFETLGCIIDEIENIQFALKMQLPAEMHLEQIRKLLPEKVEKLKRSFVEITGENPWE